MKNYAYIFLGVIVILFVVYVVTESNNISILDTILPEKIAVFKNVHMSGVFTSGEAWEIQAKEAWTSRNRFNTTLENVFNGNIMMKDRYMIKGLQARRISINLNKDINVIKSVEAEPVDKQYMVAYIDFGAFAKPVKKEVKFSLLTANDIKFNPDKRVAVLSGNIRIEKGALKSNAQKVSIDLDKDVATFETRSTFRNKTATMSADRSNVYFDIDMIEMTGSVEILQKNKKASSPRAVYDDRSREAVMTGGVAAVIGKPSSLLKKGTSGKYKSSEAKEILKTRTKLYCDKLVINTDNSNSQAIGNVDVKQKEQEAQSDKAYYNDKDGTILMTGNVTLKKKDGWIKAKQVMVYVDKGIFEASGGVETEFKVKRGTRKF